MRTCFVVTPIGSEGSEIRKRADQLLKYIIEPICEKCKFEAVRVDKINEADSITQTIIDMLSSAELVIADMTGHNPNAFYEMGFRACTGKPMIYLKQKGESIPFDIASIRAFEYDLCDLDSVDEVKKRLEQTILSFSIPETEESNAIDSVEGHSKTELGGRTVEVLPILYEIQDQISQLREEIHNNNTNATEAAVVRATLSQPVTDIIRALVKANQTPPVNEDPSTELMRVLQKYPGLLKTLSGNE